MTFRSGIPRSVFEDDGGPMETTDDERYLAALIEPVQKSRHHRPRFGTETRIDADSFRSMYGADLFYRTVGLSDPAVYAAHRAAGGMTSVYRQLGIGARDLVRAILADAFGMTTEEATWRVRGQDLGCVVSSDCWEETAPWYELYHWLARVGRGSRGVALEVRQGIKTGDARRQHSYVEANAKDAVHRGLLPVLFLLSNQANERVIEGYRDAGWRVLMGDPAGTVEDSSYAFLRTVAGFDLAAFLERHAETISAEVGGIVHGLLDAA